MTELDIFSELGDNAELLTKSDLWLTTVEARLSQNLTLLLHELDQIQTAIRIKRRLQQSNQVAVKRTVRHNRIFDEMIVILPLPQAVRLVGQTSDRGQLGIWAADGYDVGCGVRTA